MVTERTYVPAAGYHWLLPLYDVFARLVGSEAAHRQLVDQADVAPGHHVLEIGCGTGNHHLAPEVKAKTLREARRVLRDGGALHALDFCGHADGIMAHLFHRAHLGDQDRIPVLMREAGFADVTELPPRATLLGRVAYWRATR